MSPVKSQRGVVLAQVLIMTLVLGYIAAMILRMVLQPAMTASNTANATEDTKQAEAALNRVQAAWIEAGAVCQNNAALGINSCSSASCGCTCQVTVSPGVVVSVVTSVGSNGCVIKATPP